MMTHTIRAERSRRGDWAQTYTGRQFWPLDPRVKDVCIEDIAHALAYTCRFNGHCSEFYSVAQHSVMVAHLCPVEHALAGLMHDAAEAYLGDTIRPLKQLPEYAPIRKAEARLMRVIAERFGFPYPLPDVVKRADNVMLATEARDLMKPPPAPWTGLPKPVDVRIEPWSPDKAETKFVSLFEALVFSRVAAKVAVLTALG